MSKNQRMMVEALAPPFLATVCLLVISLRQESLSDVFLQFLPCLLLIYAFGIFPAFLYMVAMELWFHFGWRTRYGLLGTVGFSGLLGAVSVPLSRFTSRVGGGSAFFVRPHYTLMKIGTFPEAFHSLKEKYRKNARTLVILAWFLLGQILGTTCWYFFMRISFGRFLDDKHDDPSLMYLRCGSYLCLLLPPFIFMILGVLGILPGTRKKKLEI